MLFSSKCKWHEGPKWERFFQIYDAIAMDMFEESRQVATHYGATQVHMSGNPQNPPIVFFHGIATCSLMCGNWLFPELSKDYCCIAVDTIGDMGRSCPKDNNPGNGPGTEEETAEWIVQVLKELHIQQPVHVIGYSMGTTLGTCFARFYPEKVGKMILMAPVFLLAPVRILWLAQAISFGLLSQMVSQEGSMAKSLQDWFFGSMVADPKSLANMKHPELRKATESIGTAQVRLRPTFLDVEILTQINQNCPTLVVIGQRENVVDPQAAVAHAQKANLQVIEYENAGHMFFCESPARDDVIERAKEFLST